MPPQRPGREQSADPGADNDGGVSPYGLGRDVLRSPAKFQIRVLWGEAGADQAWYSWRRRFWQVSLGGG